MCGLELPLKWVGMLVVLLRGANHGFWSHLYRVFRKKWQYF